MRQECEAKLTLTSTNYETKIATLEKELTEAKEQVRDVQYLFDPEVSIYSKGQHIVELNIY